MKLKLAITTAAVSLILTGCATRQRGDILSTTQTVLGIDISQSPDSGIPHVRLGFIRTQFHIVPLTTNKMFAPSVNSSIAINQKLSSSVIEEDFQTGDAAEKGAANTNAETTAKVSAKSRGNGRVPLVTP